MLLARKIQLPVAPSRQSLFEMIVGGPLLGNLSRSRLLSRLSSSGNL
jgi:hypothetical protein